MTQTAIQLYTLRDFDRPLPEVIHCVADAGFDGVEFAHRIRDADASAVRSALDDRDIEPVGAHVELPLLESSFDDLLDRFETVNCDRVVLPHVHSSHFRKTDRITDLAAKINDLAARLQERGFTLVYHNTRQDLLPTLDEFGLSPLLNIDTIPGGGWNHLSDGLRWAFRFDESDLHRTGFGKLVAETDQSNLQFEVDIKNVVAAGYDPADVFEFVGDRLSLVHLADISRTRRFPPKYESVDPGTGLVDMPTAIQQSVASDADWIVFEHDRPTDPEQALDQGVETVAPELRFAVPSRVP